MSDGSSKVDVIPIGSSKVLRSLALPLLNPERDPGLTNLIDFNSKFQIGI